MEIIIPVREGNHPINARDLHEFLQVGKDFSNWIKERINQYGFLLDDDYIVFASSGENPLAGRPLIEYSITLDMAKELAMVERTERGKQARQYFIECEKKVRHQSSIIASLSRADLARMVLEEEAEKKLLEAKVEEDKPKVQFYLQVGDAKGLHTVAQVAKMLGYGQKKFFQILRDEDYLMSGYTEWNQPYQRYIEAGYFKVKQRPYRRGDEDNLYDQTFVTAKGLQYLTEKFGKILDVI